MHVAFTFQEFNLNRTGSTGTYRYDDGLYKLLYQVPGTGGTGTGT